MPRFVVLNHDQIRKCNSIELVNTLFEKWEVAGKVPDNALEFVRGDGRRLFNEFKKRFLVFQMRPDSAGDRGEELSKLEGKEERECSMVSAMDAMRAIGGMGAAEVVNIRI